MLNGYNQLVMHFIRPPRSQYDISQLGFQFFVCFNLEYISKRSKGFHRKQLPNPP